MSEPRRYRRRPDRPVLAVRLALDFDALAYRKWGAEQVARPGDWLVQAEGDTYTIAAAVFEETYAAVSPGCYVKVAKVWAYAAQAAGAVTTLEGETHYEAGDFIVRNGDEEGAYDGPKGEPYAIARATFEQLYELDSAG